MRVQLTRVVSPLIFALVLPFAIARPSAGVELEEQQAGLRFELFTDSDAVHVYTSGGNYDLKLSNAATLAVGWNHELVIVPGVSAPPGSQEAVDSISGASRPVSSSQDPYADFRKTRNQIDTQMQYWGLSGGYYVSNETDYFAQQVSGGYERSMLGDNTILAVGLSYGWDDIQPLEDDDTNTPHDRKTTLHTSFVATQVLTPTTLIQLGAEQSNVEGLQHNPYRSVYVGTGSVPEKHPSLRSRRDAFFKVNQYLPNRSSLKLDYKYYTDDWGIDSHTMGAKLHQYVNDSVVIRHRYRYYTQSAADFYRTDYSESVGGFQTVDYRMGEFSAHLFGSQLAWDMGKGPIAIPALDGINMTVKYERYFNSNNFSANIFESGLAFTF
jgi:hypothetical protein